MKDNKIEHQTIEAAQAPEFKEPVPEPNVVLEMQGEVRVRDSEAFAGLKHNFPSLKLDVQRQLTWPVIVLQGDVLLNVVPKKANWDLRRDVEKKLAKLERRTQRALVQLMQEQHREQLAIDGGQAD